MRALKPALAGLALSCAAIAPAVASAHPVRHPARPAGYVYVNDNTAAHNTIGAFKRTAEGKLTPLAGSPFATGGAGAGKATGSQGALQTADHGRYLLAVDAGSDQISVLAVKGNGGLARVSGGTVASGGDEPVSIAVHGDLVYVANAGAGKTDYTGFKLSGNGVLRPLARSTVTLPSDAQPGDVLFNSTGTRLAGTRVGSSQIDSFTVNTSGRLTAAPGSPYAAQGPGPFGSQFSPVAPTQLFVSNAHGGTGAGTVSAFRDSGNGSLTSIGSSPFADHQTAPCWVEISADGRFLFAVNTAQPSISSYAIGKGGTLTLLHSTPFKDPSKLGPVDARLSPDGKTLFVVDGGVGKVSAFRVAGGTLHELGWSPTGLPTGATPFGIVVS